MKQRFSILVFHIRHLVKTYLFGLGIFFIARLFFYLKLENGEIWLNHSTDLLKAFWVGAKFDSMVILYGLLLPLVLAVSGLFTLKDSYHAAIMRLTRNFSYVVFFIFALLLVIDIFYYDYFQAHINILFFGFFEDDTAAVLKSVWTDYPLIRVVIALTILALVLKWLLKKIFSQHFSPSSGMSALKASLIVFVFFLFYVIGMRGSLGTFPLQIDDATISENTTVNLLPMNGVFALKEAWMTRKKQTNIEGNIAWLKNIGYPSVNGAIGDYFGLTPAEDPVSRQSAYFSKTRKNEFLESNPPHVVFFMMESMSNYNMFFHSRELNLLGNLEKYWNSEIVFRKCLPFGNGTINTLEGLMVNTPVTSLAQSANRYIEFGSSMALPFKHAGYQTTYITGGKLGWRNINEFIPNQHFDRVEGNASIQQAIPEAKQCEWGVYDEYLFDYVFKLLEQSKGKPQLIFAMTTTNHTPFNLPGHYKPFPVTIPENMKGSLQTDEDMAKRNFTNLQYANDCLGRFMEKLKNSPYGANTLVAASGDHNNLMLFGFSDEQMPGRRGVPLFMSVPDAYLKNCQVDTSVYTAHKDIFPTLINLSLSNREYFNGGDFLFDPTKKGNDFFSIDLMSKEAMNHAGAVQFDPQPAFYQWVEPGHLLKRSSSGPALDSLMKRSRAYYAAMSYYIKSEIDLKKKKNN